MILETSKLVLLKNVNLNSNYEFTIDFENLDQQNKYFDNLKASIVYDNEFSYIKNIDSLKIEIPYEELIDINYFYYINENKRYYCFITGKKYIAEDTTELFFKLDYFQTYMFDYEFQESFVDREHQDRFLTDKFKNIKPIYNTLDENLNYGNKYTLKQQFPIFNNNAQYEYSDGSFIRFQQGYIVLISKQILSGDKEINESNFLANPFYCYAIPMCTKYLYDNKLNLVETIQCPSLNNSIGIKQNGDSAYKYISTINEILKCDEFKNGEFIQAIYYANEISTDVKFSAPEGIPLFETNFMVNVNLKIKQQTLTVPMIKLFGYGNKNLMSFPKGISYNSDLLKINKLKNIALEPKLNTNPYLYFELENDANPKILYNEYLNDDIVINTKFIESLQPKTMYKVVDYLNNSPNEEMIDNSIKDLPIVTDKYLSYMAQNKATATTGMAVNVGASLLNLGIGAATGGIGLAIGAGQGIGILQNITNEMLKRKDLQQQGDDVKNIGNNGYFSIKTIKANLKLNKYQITEEYRKKIYNYFYHYGYKSNEFKKPNIKSRYYFNYIKTIGCNLKSNINFDAIQHLIDIFNNGITIFHFRDLNTFKGINNYDYENVEMSHIGG